MPAPTRVAVIVNPVAGARSRRLPAAARIDLVRTVMDAEDAAGEIHVPGRALSP